MTPGGLSFELGLRTSSDAWTACAAWPDSSAIPERSWSWDSGLCMALDTSVSFVGWVLFGKWWQGVQNGAKGFFVPSRCFCYVRGLTICGRCAGQCC